MELPRSRDLIVLVTDLTVPVMVDDTMATYGWPGGQAITWVDSPIDNFVASYSDGTYGGFLLWGSDERADKYTAYSGNQPTHKFAVAATGTWMVSTSSYEKYTLQSRLTPPLVPNVYVVGTRLRFSLRGLWTPEDEWTISGDPRGENIFLVGSTVQAPNSTNNYFLMVQTAI
jgi:hypothetical protein